MLGLGCSTPRPGGSVSAFEAPALSVTYRDVLNMANRQRSALYGCVGSAERVASVNVVYVTFTLDGTGRPQKVQVHPEAVQGTDLASCLTDSVRGWTISGVSEPGIAASFAVRVHEGVSEAGLLKQPDPESDMSAILANAPSEPARRAFAERLIGVHFGRFQFCYLRHAPQAFEHPAGFLVAVNQDREGPVTGRVIASTMPDSPLLTCMARTFEGMASLRTVSPDFVYYFAFGRERPALTYRETPLATREPIYPGPARRRGIGGFVRMAFDIDRQGAVVNIRVLGSKPKGVFDEAAETSLSGFKYLPTRIGDQAVELSGVRDQITFRIE